MKESPLPRYDRPDSVNETSQPDTYEFDQWLDSEMDFNPAALSEFERHYLRAAFDKKDTEGRESMAKFIRHYELEACNALIAAEYHPGTSDRLIGQFESVRAAAGDDYYAYESSENGQQMRRMLESFNLLFIGMEEVSHLIKETDIEDADRLGNQVFEALARKGSDLIELYCRLKETDSDGAKFSIEDVSNAMEAFAEALMVLRNFFNPGLRNGGVYEFTKANEIAGQAPKYLVRNKMNGNELEMKWFVRPRAGADGQARISLELGFGGEKADPRRKALFYQETKRLKDGQVIRTETSSTFRMSIDRDTTDKDNPNVSLDICRAEYQGKTFDRTGDKMGNMLASVSEESSHTPYSFDPEFAEENRFAAIASKFAEYIAGPQSTESQK